MKVIFTIISFLFLSLFCSAQEQRALIIGIDTYSPPSGAVLANDGGRLNFSNLEGCKNDAQSIKQLIMSCGFGEKNINEIYNREATRNNILSAFNDLLKNSKRGDIAFFYYAGHGSQMRNTKSKESDQKDESIVPSDTWKAGVSDIRDKELAVIFNNFIDNGVKLTVIMDCCHSGSLSRGKPNYSQLKPRYIAESNYDVKDDSSPVAPEKREKSDFLIISAAQDNEYAQEQYDNNYVPHGAFTLALLSAIQQHSIDIPVSNLFQAAREVLKLNGKRQEPVIAGSVERQQQNIFGVPTSKLSDDILLSVSPLPNGNIIVRGGYAFGLNVDNELTKANDSTVVIKIISVNNITESEAKVIKGSASKIEDGSLFRVSNWVSNVGPLLKIYLPNSIPYKELLRLTSISSDIIKSGKVHWIYKIDEEDPDVSIYFLNNKWVVNTKEKGESELKEYSVNSILAIASGKKLYIELPPSMEIAGAVETKFNNYFNIKIVPEASIANYMVYGTIDRNNKPAFGLKRVEVLIKDSLEALPLRTRAVSLEDNLSISNEKVADSIFEFSLKLGKVRGWLSMAASKKASFFPYKLELRDNTGKIILDSIGTRIGDEISLNLIANDNYMSKAIPQRYIYSFALDKNGTMTLLFPSPNDGNQGNKFPFRSDNGEYQKEFTIIEGIEIVEPVGTDSYFLLATETPIDNYALLFNQEGVRGGERSGQHPLSDLLNMGNVNARSNLASTPSNWNLIRLSVKTRH